MIAESSIPQRFTEQALRQPDKPAIAGTAWRPSFAELDAAANGIARALADRSGGAVGRVALLMRHDAPLIAAVLGVLKAAGTAVVLNPGDPPVRLGRIRAEVEPDFVLADSVNRELALHVGCDASGVLDVPGRPEGSPGAAPDVPLRPDDVAFLVYTSGSTGAPKGIMQTHRNVLHNSLVRLAKGLGLRGDDRIVLLASPSGGQGLSTVWSTLLSGATLCPFPAMELGVTGLPVWIAEHGVTVFVSSASLFRHFVRTLDRQRPVGIRLLRLGSEPALAADFQAFRRHFSEDCVFAHTFSSSETGNITQQVLPADADPRDGGLPVGRPAEGIEVLLDDGEIIVRSDYLSPGYWRDEALTTKRFGERTFRTGDLGWISADGALTVLGRKDSQVKVRGSRVDLLEVESALAAQPEVATAAVRAAPTPRGDTRLTGYVAVPPGARRDTAGLRDALRTTLPDHAVPTAFSFVDSLPLNAHGKVDREALARLEPEPPALSEEQARGETEELVAGIWESAFERRPVGRDDDFFALGGDSLTAAVVAAGVHASFGVALELGAFAESPTVAAMAELVDRLRAGPDGVHRQPLTRIPRNEPLPCSFIQERTWRHSRTPEESAGYTLANAVRITGPLDVEALRRSVDRVVARHEALRTTFVERDGGPIQVVRPPAPIQLPLVEVESPPEADELLLREAAVPFDLERGPLLRLLLVRLSEHEHRLLRVNHHIVSDGRSWMIFFDELVTFYEADRRGEPPPLPEEEPLQYADFAAWERCALRPNGRRWRNEVDWWRANLEGTHLRMPLPFARRTRREQAEVSDGVVWFGLERELSAQLEALRRDESATYFMVRVAAFAALLAALNDDDEVVVGTYAGTRRLAETQDIFGCFTNLVALRLRFEGNPGFRDWLAEVRGAVIEMSAHSEIPYGELCEHLRAGGTTPPELHSILSIRDVLSPRSVAGIEITPLEHAFGSMPWGFSLQLAPSWEATRCLAAFDARVHDPAAVRAFIESYKRLLGDVCSEPDRPLRELLPRSPGRLSRLLRRVPSR